MKQDATLEKALEPVAVRSDEGEARWWFGGLAVIKATAAARASLDSCQNVTRSRL